MSLSALRRCIDESPTRYTARAAAHDAGRALVLGVVALQHHQRLDDDAEPLGPRHRRGDQRRRLLEGVGGRQHHDALALRHRRSSRRSRSSLARNASAAQEGDRPRHRSRRHGGRCVRHVRRLDWLPTGN